MSKSLPSQPSLEHLKNEAKQLRKAHQAGDLEACTRLQRFLPRLGQQSLEAIRTTRVSLQEAQHVVACEYGFRNWATLKVAIAVYASLARLPASGAQAKRNFTEEFRNVMADARQEGLRLGHDYVGPEHLLLALLHQPDGTARELLRHLGVDQQEMARAIEDVTKPQAPPQDLPQVIRFTAPAKQVVEMAVVEAGRRQAVEVDTGHLLRALTKCDAEVVASIFRSFDVSDERLPGES